MATNKTKQKVGETEGQDVSSISSVINVIKGVFNSQRTPVTPIPPPLLISGTRLRSGLSAKEIAGKIISRQSNAGAPVGDIFEESNNVSESMELIRVEEIINAILLDSKVEVYINPGVSVTTTGIGNWGYPVVSQGATVNYGFGEGVIR